MTSIRVKDSALSKLPRMEDINPNMILGYIEMHSISGIKIYKTDLERLFAKHGMSLKYLPENIRPHDAFRRATHTARQSIKINHASNSNARLLVREVVCDKERIVRHLVREVVDSNNEVLDYATVGKFIFDRDTETMSHSWDMWCLDEYNYIQIIQDTQNLFYEWTVYHTKDTVRNIINDIVNSLSPVGLIARGKASFIPKTQEDEIKALKNIIDDLGNYAHETNSKPIMELIPMMDTVEQRDLLTRRIEIEISDGLDNIITEMTQALKTRDKLRGSTVERYMNDARELKRKTEQYQLLLSTRLEILQTQLATAFDRIETTIEEEKDRITWKS